MSTIVHIGMRTIVLMLVGNYENDRAQGVRFYFLFSLGFLES